MVIHVQGHGQGVSQLQSVGYVFGNWTTRGYANSRTGQLADWTTRGCHR